MPREGRCLRASQSRKGGRGATGGGAHTHGLRMSGNEVFPLCTSPGTQAIFPPLAQFPTSFLLSPQRAKAGQTAGTSPSSQANLAPPSFSSYRLHLDGWQAPGGQVQPLDWPSTMVLNAQYLNMCIDIMLCDAPKHPVARRDLLLLRDLPRRGNAIAVIPD